MPYPSPEKRFRSDRRAARQAALLLGTGVLTAGAFFAIAGILLHRVELGLPRIDGFGHLSPNLGSPEWRQLRAVDVPTGETRWRRSLEPQVADALAQFQLSRDIDARTRLVQGTQVVRAEDVATGTVRWSADLHRPVLGFGPVSGPVVGVVVLGSETATLTETVLLDVATGRERWRTPSGLLSSFAYDPTTRMLYEYGEDRALLARDPLAGTLRWRVDRPYGRVFAHDGIVWVAGGGRLTAYDGATGATRSATAIAGLGDGVPVAVAGATAVIAEP